MATWDEIDAEGARIRAVVRAQREASSTYAPNPTPALRREPELTPEQVLRVLEEWREQTSEMDACHRTSFSAVGVLDVRFDGR